MIMELEASLTTVEPDGPIAGQQVTVHGVAEVESFVARLAASGVDSAYTTHSGRPAYPLEDAEDGDTTPVPDHVATLAVRGEFGYFHYIGGVGATGEGRTFNGHALGVAESPATWVEGAARFPGGSGIPLPLFAQALAEFVATGEPALCAAWVDEDE
jgi:hypothetical protein